jgi:hypothetical protein
VSVAGGGTADPVFDAALIVRASPANSVSTRAEKAGNCRSRRSSSPPSRPPIAGVSSVVPVAAPSVPSASANRTSIVG